MPERRLLNLLNEQRILSFQDAQKSALGEISMVVRKLPDSNLDGFFSRIKNSSGNTLVTLQAPESPQFHRHYFTKEPVNPELYQIESGSESFHLDVTQEVIGRIQKRN